MEHKHVQTWDGASTLEAYLETKRMEDRQRESDVRLMRADQKRLEAEHRIDIEAMSLTPTRYVEPTWTEPPSPMERKSQSIIRPKGKT